MTVSMHRWITVRRLLILSASSFISHGSWSKYSRQPRTWLMMNSLQTTDRISHGKRCRSMMAIWSSTVRIRSVPNVNCLMVKKRSTSENRCTLR
uniref:Putative secreted protein n=1 Tax=Anopheles darlingi TaxID=43151 RepID=A0A2M4DAY0_ANODA